MRLPKSLIKKYGISKKAWSVFRSRSHKAREKEVNHMARHRRHRVARAFGRARRSFKRGYKRYSRGEGSISLGVLGGAAVYGAARSQINALVTPKVAPYLPASVAAYADNLVLGGIGWLAAKKGKGFVRQLGRDAVIVEAAAAGAKLAAKFSPLSQQSGGAYL